jgi:hypothetical protein
MSSASFGTVNATGLNVSGVLQASEIRTTQPVQVSNLTATGTATFSNVTVNGVLTSQDGSINLQGDVYVSGNVVAGGGVPSAVQYRNLSDRTVLDPGAIYNDTITTANVTVSNFVRPIVATTVMNLRNTSGATRLLTHDTPHNDPVATTRYGYPAPLVKIQDDGSYNYINVASNTMSQICNLMLPTSNTANTFRFDFLVNDPATDLRVNLGYAPTNGQTVASYSNVIDAYTDIIATMVKRGFPLPCPNGAKTVNPRNIYCQSTLSGHHWDLHNTKPAGVAPMQMAIDINPYLAGSGTMNLYFQGGIEEIIQFSLPGVSYGTTPVVPAFPMPVTTNAAEYELKVTTGVNVVYLDTTLQILNVSIVDFGNYKTTIIDSSNVFGSNVISSEPTSFKGSFGFFRTSSKTTTTASGIEVPSSNVVMTIVSGSTPVTASPTTAEYLIQVDNQIVFKYDIVKAGVTTSTTSTIRNQYGGLSDYWTLVPYDYKSNNNFTAFPTGGQESIGFLHSNTSSTGKNDFYPFMNTNKGKSGVNFGAISEFMIHFNNTFVEPEFVKPLPLPTVDLESLIIGTNAHEIQHIGMMSIGMSQRDEATKITDDELLSSAFSWGSIPQRFGKVSNVYRSSCFQQLPVFVHVVARGGISMVAQTSYDILSTAFKGTNYNIQGLFSFAPPKFPITDPSTATNLIFGNYTGTVPLNNIMDKYDPNTQLLKISYFNHADLLSQIPTGILDSITYQNDNGLLSNGVNPSLGIQCYKAAVSNVHMYDDLGNSITEPISLWHDEIIAATLCRNNNALPERFKYLSVPVWYTSGYYSNLSIGTTLNPSTSVYIGNGEVMMSWDYMQTNDDPVNTSSSRLEKQGCVPWWPKNITGLYSNANSVGTRYVNPLTFQYENQTQDTSYRAMANVALTNYTSNVVRTMPQGACFMYAMPPVTSNVLLSGVSNVTVSLQEPSGSYSYTGGYNSNVSVTLFKYIPDRCVSNVLTGEPTSNTGAFMMSGPHYLVKGGTETVTIDLTSNIANGVNGTFRTNSANLLDNTISFSKTFTYGIDDGTVFNPPTHARAYATNIGTVTGFYQPVTFLLVYNRNVDEIAWSDADIQQKLWAYQVKPSCVKVSVNGTT